MKKPGAHAPRAFRLDDPNVSFSAGEADAGKPPKGGVVVTQVDDEAVFDSPLGDIREIAAAPSPIARRRPFGWGDIVLGRFVRPVHAVAVHGASRASSPICCSAIPCWAGSRSASPCLPCLRCWPSPRREVRSILRAKGIEALKARADAVLATDDREEGRAILADLTTLYATRPDTARARGRLAETADDIIDGADLIRLAERELMVTLDREARSAVAGAARRVSLVTAISPRAIVDLLFVAAQALRVVRRISEIYGGRPGLFGFIKLLRSVGAHLAVTGGVAVGDSLVQQVLGHGIAARLSAKLGEGVLNGLLTARVGLSAIAVCRPLPFAALPPPTVRDVAGFLFERDGPANPAG